jgi:hypothetical protein
VVEVDKAGELAKGNAAVDGLKARLAELQAEFTKVKAPAAAAAKAIREALTPDDHVRGAIAAAAARARNSDAIAHLTGGGGGGGDGFLGAGLGAGRVAQAGPTRETLDAHLKTLTQLGPTRDAFNAGRAQMRAAEQAAAAYAQTLRGKLASAVAAVRAGFNGGAAGAGGGGPGLIASLATVRNGMLALGAGAVVHGIKRVVDGIGDIRESAQRLGVSTGTFQRLNVLAEQNGTSVQALGTAFRTLANSAVQPTKESTAAFAALGVSVKDANGQFKSTNDLFFEVAAALSDVGNETQRSALAQDLLGRSAQELKPIFAGGRAEIDKQRKALAAMNVLSEETIAQADDLSDSWKAIGPSLLAAAEPLLKLLLPALTDLTTWLIKGITFTAKWLKNTDLVSIGLTALGAVLATKVLPGLQLMVGLGGGATKTLLSMAGAGAKAAFAFARAVLPLLLIEDFITFLRGGDSETGRLLDAVFGKGASGGTLKALNDMAAAFKSLWQWVLGDGQGEAAKSLFRELSEGINLIINDLLHLMGIGKGGLNGPFKSGTGEAGPVDSLIGGAANLGTALFKDIPGTVAYDETHGSIPAPASGQYGPPTATGMNGPVTYGDNIITINGMRAQDAKVVAGEMEAALERDRNAIEAQAP